MYEIKDNIKQLATPHCLEDWAVLFRYYVVQRSAFRLANCDTTFIRILCSLRANRKNWSAKQADTMKKIIMKYQKQIKKKLGIKEIDPQSLITRHKTDDVNVMNSITYDQTNDEIIIEVKNSPHNVGIYKIFQLHDTLAKNTKSRSNGYRIQLPCSGYTLMLAWNVRSQFEKDYPKENWYLDSTISDRFAQLNQKYISNYTAKVEFGESHTELVIDNPSLQKAYNDITTKKVGALGAHMRAKKSGILFSENDYQQVVKKRGKLGFYASRNDSVLSIAKPNKNKEFKDHDQALLEVIQDINPCAIVCLDDRRKYVNNTVSRVKKILNDSDTEIPVIYAAIVDGSAGFAGNEIQIELDNDKSLVNCNNCFEYVIISDISDAYLSSMSGTLMRTFSVLYNQNRKTCAKLFTNALGAIQIY